MRTVKWFGIALVAVTVILALLLMLSADSGSVSTIFVSRVQNTDPTVVSELSITSRDLNDAYARYASLADEDVIPVQETMPRFTGERVRLVFTGLTSAREIRQLVEVLESRNLTGSFFFEEGELDKAGEIIATLVSHSMPVGIFYQDRTNSLGGMDGEGLLTELTQMSFKLRSMASLIAVPILTWQTPSLEARKAATAAGFSEIVVTHSEISLSDCVNADVAGKLLLGVERGDILRVNLSSSSGKEDYLVALLDALANTNTRKKAQERLAIWTSDWGLAYPLRRIDTTEEGAIFTFANLKNESELDNVLTALSELNGKGLFYVTLNEAVREKDKVRKILSRGHELGIYVPDIDSPTAEEYLTEIISVDEEIRLQYGYGQSLPVYVPYDQEFNLLKACSAGGYSCATAYLFPIRAQDTRRTDGEEEIVADILSQYDRTVHRGELVHFDLSQYLYSDMMAARLVTAFATERCVYQLRGYHEMMENEAERYSYPLDTSQIPAALRNRIHRGQLTSDVMTRMVSQWIGSPWMDNEGTMIGFTDGEIRSVDTSGVIPGDKTNVYLTINDCDLDAFITPILRVLRKHGAKATFFLRTETADWNPNLTRAIAKEGHALALRADETFDPLLTPLSTYASEETIRQREVLVRTLQTEFKSSYDVLLSLAGDLTLPNGDAAVTRLFRAPLEETSKEGMTAVYDSGFTWCVGQVYKTQETLIDKEIGEKIVVNDEDILANLIENTEGGAILSISFAYDDEIDLPKILDEYLSVMGSRYRFVSLNEVLQ